MNRELGREISGTARTKAGDVDVTLAVIVTGPVDGAAATLETLLAHLRASPVALRDAAENELVPFGAWKPGLSV